MSTNLPVPSRLDRWIIWSKACPPSACCSWTLLDNRNRDGCADIPGIDLTLDQIEHIVGGYAIDHVPVIGHKMDA